MAEQIVILGIILGFPLCFFAVLLCLWLAEKFANRFLGGLPFDVPTAGDLWEAAAGDALELLVSFLRKLKVISKNKIFKVNTKGGEMK